MLCYHASSSASTHHNTEPSGKNNKVKRLSAQYHPMIIDHRSILLFIFYVLLWHRNERHDLLVRLEHLVGLELQSLAAGLNILAIVEEVASDGGIPAAGDILAIVEEIHRHATNHQK